MTSIPTTTCAAGTRAERLAENVGTAEVTLSAAELREIDAILPAGAFGSRYPEAMMPSW